MAIQNINNETTSARTLAHMQSLSKFSDVMSGRHNPVKPIISPMSDSYFEAQRERGRAREKPVFPFPRYYIYIYIYIYKQLVVHKIYYLRVWVCLTTSKCCYDVYIVCLCFSMISASASSVSPKGSPRTTRRYHRRNSSGDLADPRMNKTTSSSSGRKRRS